LSFSKLTHRNFKNILIIGSIGIGNLLLYRPALQQLRKRFFQAKITILVLKPVFAEVFKYDKLIDVIEIIRFDQDRNPLRILKIISKLRKKKFDLSITTFPANRLEYNVLAFLTGARTRIAHKYPRKGFRSLSFLQNCRVRMDLEAHDVIQNLHLIEPLGITIDYKNVIMEMELKGDGEDFGESFVDEKIIKKNLPLIGIHPGSSMEHQRTHSRWPTDKFVQLIDNLSKFNICIFGGPGEEYIVNEISEKCSIPVIKILGEPLQNTAAIIRHCKLFICGDSGLMHIATAVDVPTLGLFGPTDYNRTAPYGKQHRIVRTGIECSPCWPLKDVGFRKKCIHENRRCMDELSVEKVFDVVNEMLKED